MRIIITKKIYDDLKMFESGPLRKTDGPTKGIELLVDFGLIAPITMDEKYDIEWKLTKAGLQELAEFEDRMKSHAADKAYNGRHDVISVFGALTPVFTFFLGYFFGGSCG